MYVCMCASVRVPVSLPSHRLGNPSLYRPLAPPPLSSTGLSRNFETPSAKPRTEAMMCALASRQEARQAMLGQTVKRRMTNPLQLASPLCAAIGDRLRILFVSNRSSARRREEMEWDLGDSSTQYDYEQAHVAHGGLFFNTFRAPATTCSFSWRPHHAVTQLCILASSLLPRDLMSSRAFLANYASLSSFQIGIKLPPTRHFATGHKANPASLIAAAAYLWGLISGLPFRS